MGCFKIIVGDITDDRILENHDLIINPTNPRMVCGAGVSGAIFHKAGVERLENYTQTKYNISYFTNDNLMKVGEIRITPGFDLGMDIMFAQGPRVYDYDNYSKAKDMLLNTYKNIINAAYYKGYKNILLPSMGTGSYGFEHEDTAKDVIQLINDNIKNIDINIDYVLYNEEDLLYYENNCSESKR